MIRITHMFVENFLSFGKAEFDFRDAGLVLVEGENLDDASAQSNGSGKSAMIDALVWCLFGTTLRGYESDEVINRRVGEDCQVTVSWESDDEIYSVVRSRRHSTFKNSLRVVHLNSDEDMTLSSNTETQELVEKLIGCSMRTFLSSVVFGQDSAYRFSSLTDKEQKEILDEVLGVERFSAACGAARAQAAVVDIRLDTVTSDLAKANDAHRAAEEEQDDLELKNEGFEQERETKLEQEREKLRKAKEWVKKNAKIDADKLKALHEKAVKNATAHERVVEDLNDGATRAAVERARAKVLVEGLRLHVKSHEALAGDCPTCGQRVDDMQRDRVLGDFKKKLTTAAKALEKVDAAVAEIDEDFAKAKRKLADARNTVATAQREVNEAVGAGANLIAWRRRVADHEERIAELEKETSPYTALAKKAALKREKHAAEIKLLAEQVTAEEAKLKLADFWVDAFGAKGLRSLLLDSSLPLLNEEATRISRAVTGGAITIEFSATSELKSGKTIDRFEVKVDNKHGAASYFGNSSGERAKVDLCVGLALQRLVASRSSASFNVCFFDEVFDHLDSAAHERVVDVLSEIDKESVFVVSHDEDLKAWFPASLKVVKENGFSTVEE